MVFADCISHSLEHHISMLHVIVCILTAQLSNSMHQYFMTPLTEELELETMKSPFNIYYGIINTRNFLQAHRKTNQHTIKDQNYSKLNTGKLNLQI